MNILFFGSDSLLERVRNQTGGLTWDIHRANSPKHVMDFEGTHSFQAALFGMCEYPGSVREAVQNAKDSLDIPVVIGLARQDQAIAICERSQAGFDIVIPECGNDRLTKQQCDAILRFANGTPAESVTCGGVSFNMSEDKFSVNGLEVYLPPKKHKLLALLFLKRGRLVTKEMMFNHLYGWEEPPEAKIVDVFICNIRRVLREAGLESDCIQTVWGRGYRVQ